MISLSGMIDVPGVQDGSSLRSLIEKPPVCGNSFSPLTGNLLTGFRLHTGPVLIYVTNIHTHTRRPLFTDFIFFSSVLYWQFVLLHCLAPWTVQTDAYSTSKEEKQAQAQTPSTTGPHTTRFLIYFITTSSSKAFWSRNWWLVFYIKLWL